MEISINYNQWGVVMDFIEILKEIMLEKGLTQIQVSIRAGIKQSQVSEWLKGMGKSGYDSLKNLCKALDVTGDQLLGLTDE